MEGENKKKKSEKALIDLGNTILKQIESGENPSITLPTRGLANVKYNKEKGMITMGGGLSKRYFLNVGHVKKFVQTLGVAAVSKMLIDEGKHTVLRDVFYILKHTIPNSNINLVDVEEESNKAIEDLELVTDLMREQLHINADRNGTIVGDVVIADRGDTIDWSKLGSGGWSVPSNVEDIDFKKVNAKFVLYIEKQAVLERIIEDKAWKKLNCIVLAGKGQSTRGMRRLLQRLYNEHGLPIYVLADLDPYGFYIYSVIKFGSISLAYASEKLALPQARFLGLRVDDVAKYDLKRHLAKFKDVDLARQEQIMNYEWFKKSKAWMEELNKLKELGGKMELNAFASKGISFLTEHYLPDKLKEGDFLD